MRYITTFEEFEDYIDNPNVEFMFETVSLNGSDHVMSTVSAYTAQNYWEIASLFGCDSLVCHVIETEESHSEDEIENDENGSITRNLYNLHGLVRNAKSLNVKELIIPGKDKFPEWVFECVDYIQKEFNVSLKFVKE